MQQLSQMNNIHGMAAHQMHDLPPPPPVPADQHQLHHQQQMVASPKMSPPNVAPPPPPPPPPLLDSPPKKMMGNGDALMANGGGGGGGLQAQMSRVTLQKKVLPPQQHTDTRSDLMKAIRDGEWRLLVMWKWGILFEWNLWLSFLQASS